MIDDKFPKSENLVRDEAENYFITGASWDTGYGPSYEIGVRDKKYPKVFTLIQPNNATENTIKMLCEMVKVLLNHGFTPTEISRVL